MIARAVAVGDDAVLIEVGSPEEAAAVAVEVRRRAAANEAWVAAEVVPGAASVLVDGLTGVASADLASEARSWSVPPLDGTDGPLIELPVIFDGPDLDEVASLWGVSARAVVDRVAGADLRVAFSGFAPGFGYLTGLPAELAVPRHDSPRTRVPAGSVGLAGRFAGVYPQVSPGGWQLIGRLAEGAPALWDADREEPALLAPGTRVRMVAAAPGDRPPGGALDGDATAAARSTARSTARSAAHVTAGRAEREGDAVQGGQGVGRRAVTYAGGVEVIRAGALATVQDRGRVGAAHLGVPRSGAADLPAHDHANALVGNPAQAATIEATATGCAVRALRDLVVAVAGAPCPVWVGDVPAPFGAPVRLRAGQVVELGAPDRGLRSYLAVRGGVEVDPVLGSRATDILSGLGPAPLEDGVLLAIGDVEPPSDEEFRRLRDLTRGERGAEAIDVASADERAASPCGDADDEGGPIVVHMLPGPHADWLEARALERLGDSEYVVTDQSNRVGVRLDGPTLTRARDEELPSAGLVLGAVQVPPSGLPVVFLADHPTTGGYPVIGVVDAAGVAALAQARPGDRVRFAPLPGSR